MKTVWITGLPKSPAYVDLTVRSVLELPRAIVKL
jgi:hypothetical protein